MAEVLPFTGNTILPEDPNSILEKAKAWDLEQVVVVGWNKQKELEFGGSHCEVAEILLLLEKAKKSLLDNVES